MVTCHIGDQIWTYWLPSWFVNAVLILYVVVTTNCMWNPLSSLFYYRLLTSCDYVLCTLPLQISFSLSPPCDHPPALLLVSTSDSTGVRSEREWYTGAAAIKNTLDCRQLTIFYLILLSTASNSNPGFSQLTQNNGLIMPCLMERQNTAVTSSLTTNPSAGAAAGAASYFDIASANPTLTAAAAAAAAGHHLTSAATAAAFHQSPRVTEALSINNNASLLSQKADLHRSAAGTLILSISPGFRREAVFCTWHVTAKSGDNSAARHSPLHLTVCR